MGPGVIYEADVIRGRPASMATPATKKAATSMSYPYMPDLVIYGVTDGDG
jgi:hypothetical protein